MTASSGYLTMTPEETSLGIDMAARGACSTLGDRAFPVTAARARNALTVSIQSVSSLAAFRRLFKKHFKRS